MATKGNQKKRVVWQDFRPAQNTPKLKITKQTVEPQLAIDIDSEIELEKELKKQIPQLPKIKNKFKKTNFSAIFTKIKSISQKRKLLLIIICCLLIGSGISGYIVYSNQSKSINTINTNKKRTVVSSTPDYETVIPAGKSIQDFGGWTRVSPPDRDPVFAYSDSINGKPINVSQQPLPAEFKSDTAEQVEALAQEFRADRKINADETVVYIGLSAKGPQSLIFTKNDLLIMIKSSVPIEDNDWISYIISLQ